MSKKHTPVPIEAVLSAISKVLQENIGKRFDLEIIEKEVELCHQTFVKVIDINLRIEEPIAEGETK